MIFEHSSKNKKMLFIIFGLFFVFGSIYLIINNWKQTSFPPATVQEIKDAFLIDHPNWNKLGYFDVVIEENSPTHAMGQVFWTDNQKRGIWFAARVDGNWIITDYRGIGYFGICQNFQKYNFPKEMTPDCWDEEKQIMINTSNPDRFYNGLNVEDKEKIVKAFLEYRGDEFADKDLYVGFKEYIDGYLTGFILIGGIENHSTPYFLAAKVDDDWKILYWGQEDPSCEDLEGYDVPVELAPYCWTDNGTGRIKR